ncbi:MAG: hypothetical protein RBS36_09650 [Thiomicrospira sp.]|jgi:hypothetical protein|nr:hypothetical protein [Thiomicrospira sp.]
MATITFDTLELTDILKKTNIPPEQAEAIVRAIAKAQDGIVTKDYLDYRIDKLDIKITFLQWVLAMNTAALLALVGKLLFS